MTSKKTAEAHASAVFLLPDMIMSAGKSSQEKIFALRFKTPALRSLVQIRHVLFWKTSFAADDRPASHTAVARAFLGEVKSQTCQRSL
jgi:hypothetical protein